MFNRFNTLVKKTHYAPAERLGKAEVGKQSGKIAESEFLDNVLTKMPFVFLIVNHERQILYTNEILLKSLGYEDLNSAIGLRPGEFFSCVHAEKEEGGCGTTKHCRYCGAVNAMMESQKKQDLIVKECRLTTKRPSGDMSMDFEVASKPFVWRNETYYILTLNDISSKKRREQLERVFFHDLTNKTGSLAGLIDLIQRRGFGEDSASLIDLVNRGMKELLKDISYQKQIQQAENGNLKIQPVKLNSLQIMFNIRGDFRSTLEKEGKHVDVDQKSDDLEIQTDEVLLNRILTNLIKNALEASITGDRIQLSFKANEKTGIFRVCNPTVMEEKVKNQVFQRSFSTKGTGRGIGTYSIKLFTENYLEGKAWFESTREKGTCFYIELPLSYPG